MPPAKPVTAEFEVGKYMCPKTKSLAPLMAPCAFTYLEWPCVIEHCALCGERHVLHCEDVLHAPAFGYE